jgi:hypothetical protein
MPASHEFVVNGNDCSIDLKIYYENISNKKIIHIKIFSYRFLVLFFHNLKEKREFIFKLEIRNEKET